MTTRSIRLSRDVTLPLDAVTQTFAALGKRGSGKTNTASVLFEQFVKAGLPAVYVDPIGVTWGLRHSRDGKGPGLPVVILGGEHADVPLEEGGGIVIADFVIEHRAPVVLDLGLLSKSAQRRFMVDFAERLYHKNRTALHVMLDECDTFVPQRIDHGGERLVGAINDLVRKGRARGLGVTLISQRPALVNKDVLTQVEVLIAHRMTGPQDRDAIERWIEHNAGGGDDVLASLQQLADGEAWVWSPSWLKTMVRTRINLRETFDSSATPKAGERKAAPKKAAEVDLASLREQLAATIEKAKADDPRELKRRIAELEKQAKAAPAKPVEIPAMTKAQERELAKTRELLESLRLDTVDLKGPGGLFADLEETIKDCRSDVANVVARIDKVVAKLAEHPPLAAYGMKWADPNAGKLRPVAAAPQAASKTNGVAAHKAPPTTPPEGSELTKGQYTMLQCIVQLGTVDRSELTTLTGYKRSTRNRLLQELHSLGCTANDGESVSATDEGRRRCPVAKMPTGDALLQWYLSTKLSGGQGKMLTAIVAVHPGEIARDDLDEPTGFARSTRNRLLQELMAARLITSSGRNGPVRASDKLFD